MAILGRKTITSVKLPVRAGATFIPSPNVVSITMALIAVRRTYLRVATIAIRRTYLRVATIAVRRTYLRVATIAVRRTYLRIATIVAKVALLRRRIARHGIPIRIETASLRKRKTSSGQGQRHDGANN
jgi:hypothetical protein